MAMAASLPHKFGDLIPFKLDLSSNYVIWNYAMATLLQAFNLYGYVDGTFENDNGDEEDVRFDAADDKAVMALINSTLAPPTMAQVTGCRTSKELWVSLEQKFETMREYAILKLDRRLKNLELTANVSTEGYVAVIEDLRANLAALGRRYTDAEVIEVVKNNIAGGLRFAVFGGEAQAETPPPPTMELHDFYVKLLDENFRLSKLRKDSSFWTRMLISEHRAFCFGTERVVFFIFKGSTRLQGDIQFK